MRNTSSKFKEQIKGIRNFCAKIIINYSDGSAETLTDLQDFKQLKFTDECSGPSEFELGTAVIGEAQITLNNRNGKFSDKNFYGAHISAYSGILVDGKPELLEMGHYIVDEPVSPGISIVLTAYDNMILMDKAYKPNITYPATLARIAQDACSQCGVILESSNFPRSSYVVETAPTDTTCREVIAAVAQLAGCFAKAKPSGKIAITWYADKASKTIDTLYNKNVCTDDVTITGIEVEAGKTIAKSGADGYRISISNNILLAEDKAQDTADYLGGKLIGLSFRPLTISCQSDPSIEAGDRIIVKDEKGSQYQTVVTSTTFAVLEAQKVACNATSPTINAGKRLSETSKAIIANRKYTDEAVEHERSEREAALENLNKELTESSGMYLTSVKQEDGSTIYYMHDKPELSDSMIIWKLTAEAIGISTDGGKTYPYGLDVSGTAILERLYVTGINAKYVKIGEETVTEYIERIEKDAEDALESLKKTVTTQGSSLETMQNQIREKVWKSDITTEIDGLKIGGRNYAKNSASLRLVPNGTDNYDLEIPLYRPQVWDAVKNAGHEYTVSFDMQAETALTEDYTTQVWIKQAPWYSAGKITYPKGSTQKVHYSLTAKADDDTLNANLFIRFMKKDTVPMLLTKIKVEAGNRETDWILAPEDVQENIDTAQTSADQAKTTITETSAQVETIKTATEALTKAIQSYVKTDDFTKYQKQIESQLSQTPEAITARFTAIEQTLADASDNASGRLSKLESYIQMTADGIILGRSDDPITLAIQNGQICFMQSGTKVAWFTNNQLYISNATITETANIVGLTVTKSGRHLQIN